MKYPRWLYYPRSLIRPDWVSGVVDVFSSQKGELDTNKKHNTSNVVLGKIRDGLENIGFHVEGGAHEKTIYRPVHFGEFGQPDRQYQIDSYNPELKIGLEVEAGRSIRGNAVYRDIIQTSLLVDVEFFVIAIPQKYRFKSGKKEIEDKPYEVALSIFDAIYSSERFKLPLLGCLIIGF